MYQVNRASENIGITEQEISLSSPNSGYHAEAFYERVRRYPSLDEVLEENYRDSFL